MSKKSTHHSIAIGSIAELQNLHGSFQYPPQKSCLKEGRTDRFEHLPRGCQVANLDNEEAVLPEHREGLWTES